MVENKVKENDINNFDKEKKGYPFKYSNYKNTLFSQYFVNLLL